ncbi:hypothetical protein EYF80_044297 [Liparis tanakae]|uniref:Uncharacterized protein n=1 Tax=Liparis tanakae TaxID=230148 RepID=A0A4Z2FXP9_9TELE|nr:hypothetical protein EYF80_044297 [Liparis tanakae]
MVVVGFGEGQGEEMGEGGDEESLCSVFSGLERLEEDDEEEGEEEEEEEVEEDSVHAGRWTGAASAANET